MFILFHNDISGTINFLYFCGTCISTFRIENRRNLGGRGCRYPIIYLFYLEYKGIVTA
jgi:hypothetical protein